jgi:hypothetical protein
MTLSFMVHVYISNESFIWSALASVNNINVAMVDPVMHLMRKQ